jgi:hypothetical protein
MTLPPRGRHGQVVGVLTHVWLPDARKGRPKDGPDPVQSVVAEGWPERAALDADSPSEWCDAHGPEGAGAPGAGTPVS